MFLQVDVLLGIQALVAEPVTPQWLLLAGTLLLGDVIRYMGVGGKLAKYMLKEGWDIRNIRTEMLAELLAETWHHTQMDGFAETMRSPIVCAYFLTNALLVSAGAAAPLISDGVGSLYWVVVRAAVLTSGEFAAYAAARRLLRRAAASVLHR
eukprot:gene9367-4738_t